MSAKRLREAAALMRERANRALPQFRGLCEEWFEVGAPALHHLKHVEQRHIASVDPAVALAVADWLDSTATAIEDYIARQADPERKFDALWTAVAEERNRRALAVADAYLAP